MLRAMTRALLIALGLGVALLVAGCSDPFRDAAERDTAEAWRAYLAAEQGSETERSHAETRLEALMWEEAESLDSIASYRRYLEAFPRGRNAARAVARLESLRYERASAAGDLRSLEEFLARHPDGRHAPEARVRLAEVSRRSALESGSPEDLEAFLRRFPGADGQDAVEEALARIRFEEAVAEGTLAALERHLRRFPQGPHRAEAELLARGLRIRARILAGDLDAARRLIEGTGLPESRARLEAEAAAARLEIAALGLDLPEIRRLAETALPPTAAEATEILRTLESRPDRAELEAAARRLVRPDPGLPPAAIEAGLRDRDARRRLVSVRALGHSGDPAAIGRLTTALEDRNLAVRAEAAAALRQLGASLPPVVRDVYFTEALIRYEGLAAEPHRIWMASVLLEAVGLSERARDALRRAAEDPEVVLARLRLAEIETEPHRVAVPLTGAALWLRDAVRSREEAVRGLGRSDAGASDDPAFDGSLLRQMRPLLDHLEAAVARASAEADAERRFTWLPEVRQLQDEMTAVLADAEARARLLDPTWVDHDVDEGAGARAVAEAARVEAVRRLAEAAPDVPAVRRILERAAASPHPTEAAVAAAARGSGEGE
jgi:hypothetical protein